MHALAASGPWDAIERSIASGVAPFVVTVVAALIALASLISTRFPRRPTRSLDDLADDLAGAMRERAGQEVVERDLTAPMPITWHRASAPIGAPARNSLTGPFEPLPGSERVTGHDRVEGTQQDLYGHYAGLPSGRLVIAGPAGAGKSTAAVLLFRDALAARERVGPDQRSRVPVPIMANLRGWDAHTTSLATWITDQIAEIPGFAAKDAARLVAGHRVAVLVDGLDEIGEGLRPVVLRELSRQADLRLVLLSRIDELSGAVRRHPLVGAAGVELRPVDEDVAVDYLLSRLSSPPPSAWQKVTDRLRRGPAGPLTGPLKNPFLLTLLRDAYGPLDPVDELLDRRRFRKARQVERHLLDRALATAYASGPERPAPRYSLRTAQRTLGFLAHHLGHTGDSGLKWWDMPPTGPQHPVPGTLSALAVWFTIALPTSLLLGLSYRLADGRDISSGLPIGLLMGLVSAFASIRGREPMRRRVPRGWWRAMFAPRRILVTLPLGFGLVLPLSLIGSVLPGVGGYLLTGLAVWLTIELGASLFSTVQPDDYALDPRRSWRDDAVAGATLAATGTSGAFVVGIGFGMHHDADLPRAVAIGGLGALANGIWLWSFSTVWRTFCRQVEMAVRFRLPLRMRRFLEDARERQILRTAGPVYQFRHDLLRERLAETWGGAQRSVPRQQTPPAGRKAPGGGTPSDRSLGNRP
ncbi:hypothetical protein [Micromonospora robiginosa]|uniref:NACHT domain-containing protein n=1 Tax=Micromonospora robiginosa TaxID=2749844 RepID=A0A7L6B4G7_9ACTN|nr:hypothetical protein [Micromonospora ferruginea]QLQ36858.1 hypothetical protein H1D33_27035 [Micromonospora ferruginea]